MEAVLGGPGHALSLMLAMFWEILWALILGFACPGGAGDGVQGRDPSKRSASSTLQRCRRQQP
jgi:hypothetical protein